MKRPTRKQRLAYLLLFWVGAFCLLTLAGMLVWADLEASMFDASFGADGELSSLSCPLALGSKETGYVRASFGNDLERTVTRSVRVHISNRFVTLLRGGNDDGSDMSRVQIAPRETKTLEWKVFAEDAVWGRFVFVRVYLLRNHPQPSQSGSCGILAIPLPLPGVVPIVAVIVVGMGCMGLGWWRWKELKRQQRRLEEAASDLQLPSARTFDASSGMLAVGIITTITLVVAIWGAWLLGILLLILLVILLFSMTASYFLAGR